ncbi:taste receptor type 2 member 4-like [Phyllobates terribilis]|uniref:taste receptor type 2 member 4-like n=1 Tax=Phyllobates terribilis TaxID=111132 RepID=UPI003CCA8B63
MTINIPLWFSIMLFSLLESLVGIILNIFLIVVNRNILRIGNEVNPSALLQFFIAMINIFLLSALISEALLFVVFSHVFLIKEVIAFYLTIITVLMYFQYWLITWLCLFYFTRTTTFSHKFFIWLKRNIPQLLPYLLLISAVLSFAVSILFIPNGISQPQPSGNATLILPDFTFNTLYMMLFTFLGCWTPFIVSFLSAGFTASSLLTHIRNMKQGVLGFTRPQLKIYVNAVRTMTLLILLSVSYYLVAIFGLAIPFKLDDLHLLNWLFGVSYPTIEVAIIIQSNTKLRRMLQSWCSFTCRKMRNKQIKVSVGCGGGV